MIQSVLKSAGVQAALVESEWWTFFWITTIVTVVVLLVLAAAVKRGVSNPTVTTRDDRRLHRYIAVSGALTVLILIGLLVRSVVTSRALASERIRGENVTEIEVTAYQWWWSVEYQHPEPEQRVRTANELHVPVGRTVAIKLLASDVIHSFWVPSLAGKLDAIPGHEATLWLRAEQPGVYRGQCAEYCGFQHAHMAFVVIAEPADQFERWIQAQRATANQPQSDLEQRGLQLVQRSACVMCHTIRGTAAGGRMGPDLTHYASRSTIAAGTLPRTPEHTMRWLADPQAIKPGSRMPTLALSAGDRSAIAAYLEQLR